MRAIELADHRYVHHLMCYGGTFWNYTCLRSGLFLLPSRGSDLRLHDAGVGVPRRVRTSAVRLDSGDTQAFYLIAGALAVGTILPSWFPHRTGRIAAESAPVEAAASGSVAWSA